MNRPKRLRIARTAHIYSDIHSERERAHAKHVANGRSMEELSAESDMWLPVLVEEVGEVARALCDAGDVDGVEFRRHLREELVQVAAMACAWVAAIDELSETR